MSRARWHYAGIKPGVVFIIDGFSEMQPTMSVTNDAEAVTTEVHQAYPGRRIIYRDTDGQWDELLHDVGVFKGFARYEGELPE